MDQRIRKYYMFLVSFFCMLHVNGNVDTLFNTANKLYEEKAYEDAIQVYEAITDSGYVSAELYFNMGNAYYKTHQVAPAILYYEKAKKLKPNDDDINYNLELARTHMVDRIEHIPPFFIKRWINGIVQLCTSNTWAIISLSLFVAGIALIILFLLIRILHIRKLSFWTGTLFIIFAVLTYLMSVEQKEQMTSREQAIIFAPSVTIKSEPDESSTDLFVLHEGIKVNIEAHEDEWIMIRLPDGKKGWVKGNVAEII
jgi:tetratricopeptide (TPR) repeat protein